MSKNIKNICLFLFIVVSNLDMKITNLIFFEAIVQQSHHTCKMLSLGTAI